MTCFSPLQAIRLNLPEPTVKVISNMKALQLQGTPGLFQVPCGQCVGCRLSYSKSWAVRNCHEAQVHEMDGMSSTFVTLTYNDFFNDLNGGALNYRDFQLFIKRLRFALSNNLSDYGFIHNPEYPLRFYMCGEYGTRTFRPHFHVLFYNLGFSDEKLYKVTSSGHRLYSSESLLHFWRDPVRDLPMGYVVHGDISISSAGYVSRYCVKKALGGKSVHLFNHDTGEFMPDEFTQMSRRPGIAYEWFKRFSQSVYPDDKLVMSNGMFYKPPRYYDNLLESSDPSLFEQVKQSRIDHCNLPHVKANNSIERLIVRENIQLKKLELLPRIL